MTNLQGTAYVAQLCWTATLFAEFHLSKFLKQPNTGASRKKKDPGVYNQDPTLSWAGYLISELKLPQ